MKAGSHDFGHGDADALAILARVNYLGRCAVKDMKVFQEIPHLLVAIANCKKAGESHAEWLDRHEDRLEAIMRAAPSGSGIDSGTKLDDSSTPENLVFTFEYHHMNENGMYVGWTNHKCVVTPSLQFGYLLKITGRNRNDIKDYLYDVYAEWLNSEVKEISHGS